MGVERLPSRPDLPGLQYLRGLAALLVVLFHLWTQIRHLNSPINFENLWCGVDLFFEISGFVMIYSTCGGTSTTPGAFLMKRLVRIAPLYWALTAFVVLISVVAPQLLKSVRIEFWHTISSFLFIPSFNPSGGLTPVISLGWTLNFEMFFYLVFALAIAMGRGNRLAVFWLASAPLVVCSVIGIVGPPDGALSFYFNPVLLEFVMGMALATFMTGRALAPAVAAVLVIGGLAAMLLFPPHLPIYRSAQFGIPALALLAAGVLAPWFRSTALHRLGDISYSLYLTHFFTVSAVQRVWIKLLGPLFGNSVGIFYLVGTASSIAVGYFCWLWVERPLTAWIRSRLQASGKPPSRSADA